MSARLLVLAASSRPIPAVPVPRDRTRPPIFPLGTAWAVALDGSIEPPLAVDEQRLYVATRDGTLRALDRRNGGEAWRVHAPGPGLGGPRRPRGSSARRTGRRACSPVRAACVGPPSRECRGRCPPPSTATSSSSGARGSPPWRWREARSSGRPGSRRSSRPPALWPRAKGLLVGEADGTLRLRERTTGATAMDLQDRRRAPRTRRSPTRRARSSWAPPDRRLLRLAADSGKQKWRWKVGADVRSPGRGRRTARPLHLVRRDALRHPARQREARLAGRPSLATPFRRPRRRRHCPRRVPRERARRISPSPTAVRRAA